MQKIKEDLTFKFNCCLTIESFSLRKTILQYLLMEAEQHGFHDHGFHNLICKIQEEIKNCDYEDLMSKFNYCLTIESFSLRKAILQYLLMEAGQHGFDDLIFKIQEEIENCDYEDLTFKFNCCLTIESFSLRKTILQYLLMEARQHGFDDLIFNIQEEIENCDHEEKPEKREELEQNGNETTRLLRGNRTP